MEEKRVQSRFLTSDKSRDCQKRYEILKQQRSNLHSEIMNMASTHNTMAQQEQVLSDLIMLQSSSETCSSVIQQYTAFVDENKQYIAKIKDTFNKLWDGFEREWTKWQSGHVVAWMKYQTLSLDTESVDWTAVQNGLASIQITGAILSKCNEVTLHVIGIKDAAIAKYLVSGIEVLAAKYEEHDDGDGDIDANAPKEFVCPLTKKLMNDPVIAFDGHCYERCAIEEYLKTHHKSPMTGEKAQYLVVFPNHQKRAEIKKYLAKNQSDTDKKQGNNETSYHK